MNLRAALVIIFVRFEIHYFVFVFYKFISAGAHRAVGFGLDYIKIAKFMTEFVCLVII
ncbi:hypothetical protein SDC9_189542 [bioreactor metagenome]|uniref:Uncharacterized protein n=1 Tax=bioreactor metagenome TaxID=1076179 RepID=A0A645HSR3_9ZZZZ